MDIKKISITIRNTPLWSKFDFMNYLYQEDFQLEEFGSLRVLKLWI